MILSPVSILDCSIAGVILAPQLLWSAGVLATLKLVCAALPLIRKQRTFLFPLLTPRIPLTPRTLRLINVLHGRLKKSSFSHFISWPVTPNQGMRSLASFENPASSRP